MSPQPRGVAAERRRVILGAHCVRVGVPAPTQNLLEHVSDVKDLDGYWDSVIGRRCGGITAALDLVTAAANGGCSVARAVRGALAQLRVRYKTTRKAASGDDDDDSGDDEGESGGGGGGGDGRAGGSKGQQRAEAAEAAPEVEARVELWGAFIRRVGKSETVNRIRSTMLMFVGNGFRADERVRGRAHVGAPTHVRPPRCARVHSRALVRVEVWSHAQARCRLCASAR